MEFPGPIFESFSGHEANIFGPKFSHYLSHPVFLHIFTQKGPIVAHNDPKWMLLGILLGDFCLQNGKVTTRKPFETGVEI